MIHISDSLILDQALYNFISKTLQNLELEIQECSANFPLNIFFSCTEMSWIGLLSNSIRNEYPKASILTELTLYAPSDVPNRTTHKGRLDLLVSYKHSEEKRSILVEAKLEEFNSKASEEEIFKGIEIQLERYSQTLQNHFKDTTPNQVSILFEWIRNESRFKDAENRFNELKSNPEFQFVALFTLNGSGLLTYGKLK